MRGHQQAVPRLAGLFLVLGGFVCVVCSFFLLPLYITTLNCIDACGPPLQPTAWESSLNLVAHLSITPVAYSLILVLYYLPLLAGVVVVGCSLGYLGKPRRIFARGMRFGRVAGSVALILPLPFLFIISLPHIGYLGMLFGYGLLWAGDRVLRAHYSGTQGRR